MGEAFDKEAEKEKLRQQLAEEEADREATQHMSELLLQGATMTNRHCQECGDPVFRHEGREFCPSCGRERRPGGTAAEGTGAGGSDSAPVEQPESGGETVTPDEAGQSVATPGQGAQRPSAQPAQQPAQVGEADLPAAYAALARKVTALAQQAEATTDVGRTRELLAAVREGAEALRALEETGR